MGTLLRLVLLAAGLYIGYLFATPHIRAWRFKDAMKQSARFADVSSSEAMRQALLESADELGVPLSPYRLRVRGQRDETVNISAAWEEVVRVPAWRLGEWVDTLRFDYEVRGP